MVSVTVLYLSCIVSVIVGYVAHIIVGRVRTTGERITTIESSTSSSTGSKQDFQFAVLMGSLSNLTSQVGTQVDEHSARVGLITESIESTATTEPKQVLQAGQMLLSANHQLQADLHEARQEIQRQREQADACMTESRTDALTSLKNRRAYDIEMAVLFSKPAGTGAPFSLLVIDIDHFKRVNDRYGHMVGDQLLKAVSRCISLTLRGTDFVARYGGEEFVAILHKTHAREAAITAERVRLAIAERPFKVGELDLPITASIGVKQVERGETATQLFERADSALFAAKKAGRNRTFVHDGIECKYFAEAPIEVKPTLTDQSCSTSNGTDSRVA